VYFVKLHLLGDFVKFAKGVQDTLGNMEKMELFNVLRRSMNIEEGTELWEST
jgi:hypothetical protein